MNWKATVEWQLSEMGIWGAECAFLREKDSILLCRVRLEDRHFVLKYFQNEEYRREIANYRLLQSFGIQTLPLIALTDRAILMEDMAESSKYRLGLPEDLDDLKVSEKLALWYRKLHDRSRAYVNEHGTTLYDETEQITRAELNRVKERTKTQNAPVWLFLEERFDEVRAAIHRAERTLTYNDFYYTNLIVSKDKSEAFMFDYNLLGKGYVYSDLRNVTWHMSRPAAQAFLRAYGSYNENEVLIDQVASVLTTLIFACRREELPSWAGEPLEKVCNGELLRDLHKLLNKTI